MHHSDILAHTIGAISKILLLNHRRMSQRQSGQNKVQDLQITLLLIEAFGGFVTSIKTKYTVVSLMNTALLETSCLCLLVGNN